LGVGVGVARKRDRLRDLEGITLVRAVAVTEGLLNLETSFSPESGISQSLTAVTRVARVLVSRMVKEISST